MTSGDDEVAEPSGSDSSEDEQTGESTDEASTSVEPEEASAEMATSEGEDEEQLPEEVGNNSPDEGTEQSSGDDVGEESDEGGDGEEDEGDEEGDDDGEDGEREDEEGPKSDGGTAQSGPTYQPDTAAEGALEGAPDDEEMPLTDHIEEMIRRLGIVIIIMAGVSLVIFPVAPDLINWLWYSFLPGNPESCVGGGGDTTACPRVYHPLALLFARLKVASLAGFIIALPVFVYQTYQFMRPGLYPHERRYYLAAVPTSLLLAFVGLAFAYFLVLPFIFTYFLFYSEDVAEIAFGLTETFDLILLMLGLFAAIFQIPLFIMLAIMMGVTTRQWLEEKRYFFWLGFAGFAFLFSPDPTGMAPFMVGITMVILYELTLLLLRWTGR